MEEANLDASLVGYRVLRLVAVAPRLGRGGDVADREKHSADVLQRIVHDELLDNELPGITEVL